MELGKSLSEEPQDISTRVAQVFGEEDKIKKSKLMIQLQRELITMPTLTLTLDYTTLAHALFVKSLLGKKPEEYDWKFAIRATESQMKEATNVFNSGVEWIEEKN